MLETRTSFGRRLIAFAAILAACLSFAAPAAALDVEFAVRPVKRDILALYDSRHEEKPDETRIHRLAEMPLNWLGFKLAYQDINAELPPPEEVMKYRGVVSWFVEPMALPTKVLSFLDAITANGVRYACLGDIAPPEPPGTEDAVGRVLGRLGLKATQHYVSVTHKVKISVQDSGMVGFERPVDQALPEFRVVETASGLATVHLAAELAGQEQQADAVLVATSAAGGYAADAYTIYYDATANRARWTLNPFAFFKAAFGAERFPVPDVTTLSGRRIYFSHIDGDGWNNISEIEGYRETQTTAAEVVTKEVIERYPGLPVSIGLIAGDAVRDLGGSDAAGEIARKLFALPQVEVASHTYSHPFEWRYYENYDRAKELAAIEKAAHPAMTLVDRVRSMFYRVAGTSDVIGTQNKYVAGSANLPRAYLKEPFDLQKEVQGALDLSSSLAPAGKKARLYLWSGEANPFEAAIAAARVAGVRNMNGGDSRLDADYPSVFYVPPIARPVGAERQIYAANSNENTYTNNWHGPYYGQIALIETLKNTETPRRLKPFNLYYHMYSGEKPASLSALKSLAEMAESGNVIPVSASAYAGFADDFFTTSVEQMNASSWVISKRGTLQTLRLDDAADIDVDQQKSSGILGSTRTNGSLYIALDPAVEPVELAIKTVGSTAETVNPAQRLVESRWQIRGLKRETCSFEFEAQGFGGGSMEWLTAPGQRYNVSVTRRGEPVYSTAVDAAPDGKLLASITINALEPVSVRFECSN